ncbi:divalent-cation tolerance protein CutA [Thiolapillus brandeum]|uniref:Periplasmic divalent cation tolerance protein n=1 Tax=Thiolapillus brandeum TaxID=1076588 RepID=A0A7U6JFN3_9GAMM|nr:divalent-cation tolerance protein CutA [Thiolapillus brandeum]BAO42966.1 periplasmic divalent cation tolerance protein [Thiolapillus brandeum]
MNEFEYLLVLCTCPTGKAAEHLAQSLVERKLAACVNISSPVLSVYRWKNKIEKDEEALLYIKTHTASWSTLEQAILELHPYDLPEIIALPLARGNKRYLNWVGENLCTD